MATYKSSKELEDRTLETYDYLEFCVRGKTLIYRVKSSYLENTMGLNSQIFTDLGIKDKFQYAKKYYQEAANYKDAQNFPECTAGSYEALTGLAIALFKDCERFQNETKLEKPLESIYKVGDRVRVKSAYDLGCSSHDYLCNFTSSILENWGGKIVTICKVIPLEGKPPKILKQYLEPFIYEVSENSWNWGAGMFEGKAENTSIEDISAKAPVYPERSNYNFYFTKEDIPIDCPYHPYVIDQAIQEMHEVRGLSYVDALKEIQREPKSVDLWVSWVSTSQGYEYWDHIDNDSSYCPEDYTPVFYRETVDKKDPSTEISQSLSTSSYEIPCSYEEVILSIKKPKIFF